MNFEDKPYDKFKEEDLPKIMSALADQRAAKTPGTVRIEFGDNGGVIAVIRESKKKYK